MEHSWVRCRAALQVRNYRIDEHFSRIQPLPDIPTSGKLRIPEGWVIIVGGACYFCVSSHIWRGSHDVREGKIDGRPNFVSKRGLRSREGYLIGGLAEAHQASDGLDIRTLSIEDA